MASLNALLFNCTLNKDERTSHTRLLLSVAEKILRDNDITVDHIHPASMEIAHGMSLDMTKAGWPRDDWPQIYERLKAADIVIIGTPIWLGEESSYCRQVIERIYSGSDVQNDKGQGIFYGKVAGALVTGNEDGIKHVSMSITWAMAHMGFTIPPQADCGWVGEAGPGPSYGDEAENGPVGFANDFTQQSTVTMTWNLIHLARLLKTAGGYPPAGNDRNAWKAGERFGYQSPQPMK